VSSIFNFLGSQTQGLIRGSDVQGLNPDDMIHFDMAGDIVKALFKKEFESGCLG
jgi:hypothetical protein